MRVLRVGFVGVRTPHTRATKTFFRDVLGLDTVRDDDDWSILQLPSGQFDFFEIYGSAFSDERLIPSDVDTMVAFVVDDLEGAFGEIEAAGIEPSDIVWAREAFDNPDLDGYGWFFFTAPDGNTYVLQQVPG